MLFLQTHFALYSASIHLVVRFLIGKSPEISKPRHIDLELFDKTILNFDKHLSSSAAEAPVKFQTDMIIVTPNLLAWWHCKILQ